MVPAPTTTARFISLTLTMSHLLFDEKRGRVSLCPSFDVFCPPFVQGRPLRSISWNGGFIAHFQGFSHP
jgi:hypothetical protein